MEAMTHKESAERRKRIAESVASGKAIGEVARMFGVDISTARYACDEHGIIRPSQLQLAKRRKRIAIAVGSGRSIDDVAERFEVCPQTVRIACKQHGVKPRHHSQSSSE